MSFHSSPIHPQGDGQAHASDDLHTPEEVNALHAYLADLSPLREAGERCIDANGGLVAEAVLRAAVAAEVPNAEAYCFFKLFYDTDEESELPAFVVMDEGREAEARDYMTYALAAGFWVAVDGQIHKLDPEIPAPGPDSLPAETDDTGEERELALVALDPIESSLATLDRQSAMAPRPGVTS